MLAYVIVVLAVVWRLVLPYFPNPIFHFTPVLAALLYFGARHQKRLLWVPVALLAATDVLLNAHYGYGLKPDVLVTWAWYAGMVLLGGLLKEKQSVARVAATALAGSVSFFLISNFMVWAAWPEIYPQRNFGGVVQALAAGVPFYRNQFAADMLFTGAVFGLPVLVRMVQREHAENQLPAE
jgi:hypothetical protein